MKKIHIVIIGLLLTGCNEKVKDPITNDIESYCKEIYKASGFIIADLKKGMSPEQAVNYADKIKNDHNRKMALYTIQIASSIPIEIFREDELKTNIDMLLQMKIEGECLNSVDKTTETPSTFIGELIPRYNPSLKNN